MSSWDDSVDLTLAIGETGEIQEVSRAAQRRLAAAAGRWRLLPGPSGLLILQRVDDDSAGEEGPGKPAVTPPGVALAGELTGPGTLTDVINFIHFNRWDGSLSILSAATRKTVFFQKGQVLNAQSNLPEDRLGAMLVRFGHIQSSDLTAAVREVTPQRRLGTILVEKGLMNAHDLYEGVRRQAEEILYSVLLTRRGTFYFSRTLDQVSLVARLHLDTQSLLLEGTRRIDEMAYFRAKLPDPEVVLARNQLAQPPTLVADALAVYQLVDGRRALSEIARESKLGEFQATKAAFELMQRGVVAVRAATAVLRDKRPGTVLPGDAAGGLIDAYNAALSRLHVLLVARNQRGAVREGVIAFLSGSAKYADLLDAVIVDDDGTLPRAKLLENLQATPPGERAGRLQPAMHELLMFVLFLAGDSIDRKDEQEMHEKLARQIEALPGAHPRV